MSRAHRSLSLLSALAWLAALLSPVISPPASAAPLSTTTSLPTIADARTQGGSPDVNFGSGFLHFATLNGHRVFTQFDLSVLPANAAISSAFLEITFSPVYTGPNPIEVGLAGAAWDEATLTWNNQPTITWGGPVEDATGGATVSWDVTTAVNAWHTGATPNYGFAFRGDGPIVTAHSRETAGPPPTLIITYDVPPPEGARPDLGDAPDSTNNAGIPNTAYPGVNGNFPTVWASTPAGQPAGPRHANVTGQAILGENLSRENEADTGPDEDGLNNILASGLNNADNDRADDGWRNRNAAFPHCAQTVLVVRVTKAPGATLNRMYLNVWFDGNHDGDWNDQGPCTPDESPLAIPATEWIVQDYSVDLTGIAAGGYADIAINTETILNTTPNLRHWMRFTLSEERAVQTPTGRADGRGPHPASALGSFQFGETEDILQRPQPAGEPGTLELEKTVTTTTNPVMFGDIVTYQIRLRHNGGTQPIEARLRDVLPFPQHILPVVDALGVKYVTVSSATGGAAPLEAQLDYVTPNQVVYWQGTLAPDSEITLAFNVHVHPFCGPSQATKAIDNVAEARPRGGNWITDTVTFNAACPGYTGPFIEFGEPIFNPIDFDDLSSLISVHNLYPYTLTLGLWRDVTSNFGPIETGDDAGLLKLTLGPDETRDLSLPLDLSGQIPGELDLPEDPSVVTTLRYCLLPGDDVHRCPDAQQYPHLVGENPPFTMTVKPRDLGDAPDSTNHAAAAMTAFPAVPAAYPTVYDPALGLPIGPLHAHPRPFHLGQSVSREAEADIGPDQDPLNNIVPAANNPNNDRFDDGALPNQWALTHCQTTNLPIQVAITPAAAAWFQQQGTTGYLNVWLDANRDGDWADGVPCGVDQAAVEHIVIDFPVDAAALGAGLHTLAVPTALVPWPAQWAEQPTWVRVTLSERPSNKPLTFAGITYGDGRGFAQPFRTGETEDYLAYPQGVPCPGPDVNVLMFAEVAYFVLYGAEYGNHGPCGAVGAQLVVQKPAQFQGVASTVIQAPGLSDDAIVETDDEIRFSLPPLEPGERGRVVVGFPLADGSFTAQAQVTVAGDVNPSNDQAQATAGGLPGQPFLAAQAQVGLPWGDADATCQTDVNVAGFGRPYAPIEILVDGVPVVTDNVDPDGTYGALLSNLSPGTHQLSARYVDGPPVEIVSPRDPASGLLTGILHVDPDLPIDPLSLTFTDSQGRQFHPITLGYSFGATQTGTFAFLRPGETYEVGVNSCLSDPNQDIQMIIAILIGLLADPDGDGRYTGSFTYNPVAAEAVTATDVRFLVTSGGATQSYSLTAETLDPGIVSDLATGQPIAGASVLALGADPGAGPASFNPWPAAALGQPNPQTTGADGSYSFASPGSLNRLEVTAAGYQPYRSWDLPAPNGLLAPDLALTPVINGPVGRTIQITAGGFEASVVRVPVGSIVEFVNLDLADHTATGAGWDSGALRSGETYRVRFSALGSYTFADAANPLNTVTIIVENIRLFFPLITR